MLLVLWIQTYCESKLHIFILIVKIVLSWITFYQMNIGEEEGANHSTADLIVIYDVLIL